MKNRPGTLMRALILGGSTLALSACVNFDFDLRDNFGNAPDTTNAVQKVTAPRPKPDNRGVISYPNYQVAIARQGDTLGDVAARVGLPPKELAKFNGIAIETSLRKGEVVALPRRVDEPSPATGSTTTGPLQPTETIDITTLANSAIDRATPTATPRTPPKTPTGVEPVRHKVERGETAFTIARLYNVSVKSLAEWNGLGSTLSVREGQYLLIPVANRTAPQPQPRETTSQPGQGSQTPVPPSAARPLPDETPTAKPVTIPASPNLGSQRTSASGSAKMVRPVQGNIIRAFSKKTDGIDIAAKAGTSVKAADKGTVAAITRDTDQVAILVIRHSNNLLTIYANVDGIKVKKGDRVKRGQIIAKVSGGKSAFLHFEVRKNFESVDPMPYLN